MMWNNTCVFVVNRGHSDVIIPVMWIGVCTRGCRWKKSFWLINLPERDLEIHSLNTRAEQRYLYTSDLLFVSLSMTNSLSLIPPLTLFWLSHFSLSLNLSTSLPRYVSGVLFISNSLSISVCRALTGTKKAWLTLRKVEVELGGVLMEAQTKHCTSA